MLNKSNIIKMKNLEIRKSPEELTESFSNSFLIHIATGGLGSKKRESLIVVLTNIISAKDAREHLRSMGIRVTSVQKLSFIDFQNQWFN